MTQRSKSTLFLIEQLIVVAVFAICAVACISIMVVAYSDANESRTISNALLKAESAAEIFKATNGDVDAVADILDGANVNGVTVLYNKDWQTLSNDTTDTQYVLTITLDDLQQITEDTNLITGQLSITQTTGEELIVLPLVTQR